MSYKTYEVEVWNNGTKQWRLNGKLHREDGPAYERPDGSKHWYLNNTLHREDGPAIEWANGGEEWWLNGQRHREDGPALERADGSKEWWLNGVEYTETEWREKVNKKDTCDGEVVVVKGKKYKLVSV